MSGCSTSLLMMAFGYAIASFFIYPPAENYDYVVLIFLVGLSLLLFLIDRVKRRKK